MKEKEKSIRERLRKPIIPIGVNTLPLNVIVHKKTQRDAVLQINTVAAFKKFQKLHSADASQLFFIEFLYESMVNYCKAFGYTISHLTAQSNKFEAVVYVGDSK